MTENKTNTIQSPLELKGFPKFMSFLCHRSLERAIWTFCELGIPDLMASYKAPITAVELGQLNGNNWNAEFLYRLLRAVTNADVIKQLEINNENLNENNHPEQSIQFQLTDDGLLLTSNHPSKTRDMILLELSPQTDNICSYYPALIKYGCNKGDGFQQTFGCSLYDYMQKEENKDYANIFNNAMVGFSSYEISFILPVIDFSHFNTLVDIGGGFGSLLSSVLGKFQNLHGILFDLPQVIENAKIIKPNEFEKKLIEQKRYDFVAGDVFKSDTIPSADAYMLKYIIHGWNDEKAIEILKSLRNANKKQAGKTITVFIAETVILSNSKEYWEVHVFDLELLAFIGSKERALSEYIYLLNESGYRFKQLHRTQSPLSIIEAITTIEDGN
ncbi:unnamed protein product [Rotaria sp. Silwood1]|nr:unnamed protein product [Rotaria sp. Silwood1]